LRLFILMGPNLRGFIDRAQVSAAMAEARGTALPGWGRADNFTAFPFS
jgi:hypothetical protein